MREKVTSIKENYDKKFEELVVARNTLEGLINATKKVLEDGADKADEAEKAAIEAALAEAEEALKGDDKEAMDAATQKLTETSSSLAQKMYADEQAAQGGPEAGDAGAEQSGNAGDDVVDAEFEEVKEDDK